MGTPSENTREVVRSNAGRGENPEEHPNSSQTSSMSCRIYIAIITGQIEQDLLKTAGFGQRLIGHCPNIRPDVGDNVRSDIAPTSGRMLWTTSDQMLLTTSSRMLLQHPAECTSNPAGFQTKKGPGQISGLRSFKSGRI